MSAELRLLDDDFDIEKIYKKVCDDALEALSKEMIKTRIINPPKIFLVSSYPLDKESLLYGFTKMRPLLTKHEDGTIIYLGTYYKPLKRRLTHGRRGSIKKFKLH